MATLESEREKRRQQKVDSGEVLVIGGLFATGYTEEEADSCLEALKAAEVARLRAEGETREISFDEESCVGIVTGVPRSDAERPGLSTSPEGGVPQAFVGEEPAASEELPPGALPQSATYVRVQIRPGNDAGDEGEIAEGTFSVERGVLVLEDCEGVRIASRTLVIGEEPAATARRLLRERAGTNFNRPIKYPNLGIA